jgi:hypothetical protein
VVSTIAKRKVEASTLTELKQAAQLNFIISSDMLVRGLTLSALLTGVISQNTSPTVISAISASASSATAAVVTTPASAAQPTTLTVTTTLVSFVATSSTVDAPVATATPSAAEPDAPVPSAPLPPVQGECLRELEIASSFSCIADMKLNLLSLVSRWRECKLLCRTPAPIGPACRNLWRFQDLLRQGGFIRAK